MTIRQKALDLLRHTGSLPDDRIDLAEAALAFAMLDAAAGTDPGPYRQHLAELAAAVADHIAAHPMGRPPVLAERVEALRTVLAGRYGYQGDSVTYEDMANANLIQVIDRRRGLPVALGILYIHAARAQGWDICGLNFPGHFLVRMEHEGERAILDPFDGLESREPQELRELLKQTAGAAAELTPDYYAPVSNREVLIRLQNNLKLRHLRNNHADRAVEVVETMLLVCPDQPALWRESGLLNAHLGNLSRAIAAFETFMELGAQVGASAQLLHQTATLVQQLKSRLN